MRIDGRQATTGTIVIGAGQRGEIDFPWGAFTLVFNPSTTQNISINPSARQITFDGTDSSLGVATTFSIPLSSGKNAVLNLAVYAIGDGASATRIVHYTLS